MLHIFLILYLVYSVNSYELKNKILSYIERKTITLSEFNSRIRLEETIKKVKMSKFQKTQVLSLLISESIIKEFFKKKKLYLKEKEIYIKILIKYYIKLEIGTKVFKDLKKSTLIKYVGTKAMAKKIVRYNKKNNSQDKFFVTFIEHAMCYQNSFLKKDKREYISKILNKKDKN